jgi:alpha-glucosidase
VISIEAARDGFVLSVDGRRVIVHGRRAPCVEIGRAELSFRRVRGSVCARRRRTSWTPLREFSIVENSEERTVIDFPGGLRMSFRRGEGLLRLSFSGDPAANLFRLRLQALPDEHVYGLGERNRDLDLKGRRTALWVEERGAVHEGEHGYLAARLGAGARGARASSFPLPTFVSTGGYWCSIDSPAYCAFDFRRRYVTTLEAWGLPREIVIGSNPGAAGIMTDLSTVLGRQPPMPSWTWDGVWLGVDGGSGGPAAFAREVDEALAAGVKIAAVWSGAGMADRHGQQARRRPFWDSKEGAETEEDMSRLVRQLRERGIRWLGNADPYVDPAGPNFARASAEGWLVRNADGSVCLLPSSGGPLSLVDLEKAEARAWLRSMLVRELLVLGASGWIADSGGRLPADACVASGADARLIHNRWPTLWAALCAEAVEEAQAEADRRRPSADSSPEFCFSVRSGWIGSARFAPSVHAGERGPSFSRDDGFPSVVPAALSLGFSGIGSSHAEVGGSRTGPHGGAAREAVLRWMEQAAFSPVFRIRSAGRADAKGRVHADAAFISQLVRMSETYAALKSYHVATAREYATKGLPQMRHPWLHYEDEEALHGRDYQYLYGRDLLVAPALSPGGELTEVWLPDDEWVHLWSSRRFRGGLVTVESPIGCPAVFYRASSAFAALFDSVRRTARWT